jgi:hypothetical protein
MNSMLFMLHDLSAKTCTFSWLIRMCNAVSCHSQMTNILLHLIFLVSKGRKWYIFTKSLFFFYSLGYKLWFYSDNGKSVRTFWCYVIVIFLMENCMFHKLVSMWSHAYSGILHSQQWQEVQWWGSVIRQWWIYHDW